MSLGTALALVAVIEGLLPFAAPARWRQLAAFMAQQPDHVLRRSGLIMMVIGVVLLYLIRA
ncbi:MAG: DUF2065 domain-containing protein [Gammaproteobacteria bacterium]